MTRRMISFVGVIGALILVWAGVAASGLLTVQGQNAQRIKDFTVSIELPPVTIEVNKGDTVALRLISITQTTGLSIPAYDIHVPLGPEPYLAAQFVADKAGTFPMYAVNEELPGELIGQLIVKE